MQRIASWKRLGCRCSHTTQISACTGNSAQCTKIDLSRECKSSRRVWRLESLHGSKDVDRDLGFHKGKHRLLMPFKRDALCIIEKQKAWLHLTTDGLQALNRSGD